MLSHFIIILILCSSTQRHEPTRKLPWWFSIGRIIIWHLPPSSPQLPFWLCHESPLLCGFGRSTTVQWRVGSGKQWMRPLSHLSPTSCLAEGQNRSSSRYIWKVFAQHDFSAHTVHDPEHEGPQCPVSIPGVVICVFSHKVNHLARVVFNIVSIISFKTCYH